MFYVPLTFVVQLSLTAASSSGSASSSDSTGAVCGASGLGASGRSGAPLSGWKWGHMGPYELCASRRTLRSIASKHIGSALRASIRVSTCASLDFAEKVLGTALVVWYTWSNITGYLRPGSSATTKKSALSLAPAAVDAAECSS